VGPVARIDRRVLRRHGALHQGGGELQRAGSGLSSLPFFPFLRTASTFSRSILAASAKYSVLSALDWSLNPSTAAVHVRGWRAIRCSSSSEFPVSSELRMFCASNLTRS
jgi:hypothetical protein